MDVSRSRLRENLHFVFVRTQFASNLGSAVRVVRNMGFEKVVLVRPACEVGVEARSFAMKGAKLLDRSQFFPSLGEAASQLSALVGASGRFAGRKAPENLISCRLFAESLLPDALSAPVGIVFGPEDNGLSSEELGLCQWLMEIPADPDYPTLNLAQAAAVAAYEANLALTEATREPFLHLASPKENLLLLQRLEKLLRHAPLPGYLAPERLMHRFRRIFVRAQLEREDAQMLQGLMSILEDAKR